ncbi:ubiquitin-specific protease ubp2 [Coemansia sp. RSA 1933]|nr:ubiquitin-specific protease ubp2 [Coemansia sp. RSA 1933]
MTVVDLQWTSGVLAPFFATTQLSEWIPTELARQLQPSSHRHAWVQHPASSSSESPSQGRDAWQGKCKDCLCTLSVFVDASAASSCIDSTGHHMHTTLGTKVDTGGINGEAHSAGSSRCCKCGVAVQLQLLPPVVDPEMVSALEQARMQLHVHHPAQGTRELVATVSALFRIARNVCQRNLTPIRTTSEKPRELLKFDGPCNQILGVLGFELVGEEFRPPDLGPATTTTENVPLMRRRLERARDELCVLAGRIQRRLREIERKELFAFHPATPALVSLLGASEYPKRPGASSLLMATGGGDEAYRYLGVPEDAADLLVVWSYSRLAEEDESVDPLTGPLAQRRFDSLVAIAALRTSEELDKLAASERDRGMVSTTQLRSACKALFGNPVCEIAAIDDDTVREMARSLITEASSTKARLEVVEHLRVLARAKHSESLENYGAVLVSELEARESPFSVEPKGELLDPWAQLPVGLNNVGNTCYLNSILQLLYSLTPIREAVMQYGDGQTWNEAMVLGRRDGGKLLAVEEIRRALRFVELLKALFGTLINHRIEGWSLAEARKKSLAPAGYPLLASPAASSLAVTPDSELSNMLLLRQQASAPDITAISISSSSTLNMQPEDETTDGKVAMSKPVVPQFHQQQDVDECMAQCVTYLVHALLPEPTLRLDEPGGAIHDDGSWIHRLLSGNQEMSTEKHERQSGTASEEERPTTEQFVNLNLNIPSEAADINDCIDAYFEPSVVPDTTGSPKPPPPSQLMDVDGSEPPATTMVRNTRIRDAPPVLCIRIQRVQFDVTTMRTYKLNSHIRLRRQISLAPYMLNQDERNGTGQYRRRQQIKDRMAAIDRHLLALQTPIRLPLSGTTDTQQQSVSVVTALERVQAFMEGVSTWSELGPAQELLADLGKPHGAIAQEARQLGVDLAAMARVLGNASVGWQEERQKLGTELNSIYEDVQAEEQSSYTLHAVFIHSGLSPEYGHYWVYIRDQDRTTGDIRWLRFNDSSVSVVGEDVVFNDTPRPGNESANPYFLVYVRTADLDQTVSFGV